MRINAQLQQGTDHSIGLLSTDNTCLDVTTQKLRSDTSHNYLLSSCHIWRTAYDLFNFISKVNLAYMQMIGIRMILTAYHLTDDQIASLTHFFNALYLKTGRRYFIRNFLYAHIG